MDYVLVTLGALLLLVGLLGCILPVLPGPPLSYLALVLLQLTRFADFSARFFVVFGIVALGVTVLDYVVPIWGTRRFGGTKAGVTGATIGLVLGLVFFPPFGILVGPFVGAFAAEALQGADAERSFRSALGSFFGFLVGTGLKLIASSAMSFYFVAALLDG